MTDLTNVIPSFPAKRFTNILPSLERCLITTTDLLTLEPIEVGKRARVPVLEVRQLQQHVITLLHGDLGMEVARPTDGARNAKVAAPAPDGQPVEQLGVARDGHALRPVQFVNTLDPTLDAALGGGFPTGHLCEITGESGAGKTQLLLTLLLAAQLPPPHGLGRPALYLGTEHKLPTARVLELLRTHPRLRGLPPATRPSLARIVTDTALDLETQEHKLVHQLPVAVRRHGVGLVVVDSIAINYRAEVGARAHAANCVSLVRAGAALRALARDADCAVVVVNQVGDWFPKRARAGGGGRVAELASSPKGLPSSSPSAPPSSAPSVLGPVVAASAMSGLGPEAGVVIHPAVTVDHQQRFFTGCGDAPDALAFADGPDGGGQAARGAHNKVPTQGITWANQIAARVVLIRQPVWGEGPSRWQPPGGQLSADAAPPVGADLAKGRGAGADDDNYWEHDSAEWTPRRWRRWAKVVFASWTPPVGEGGRGVEFEIWTGGLRAVGTGGESEL